MANIDWSSLVDHHRDGSLKEHFTSTFTSVKAKDAYLKHCNYFLSEYKESSQLLPELSISLSILKIFLSSVPNFISNDLVIEVQLLDWIQSVVSSEASKAALKGSALSILKVLVNKVPSLSSLLPKVNQIFSLVLNNLATLLALSDLNSEAYLGVVIILNQLVELLNALGSDKLAASDDLKDTLVDIAKILQCVSSLNTQQVANTTRIQVDSIKLCGMLCEIWIGIHKQFPSATSSEHSEALCSLTHSLFVIITTGDVTHDCFHSAYHGAVQVMAVLRSAGGPVGEAATVRWGESLGACVQYLSSGADLLEVVDCARVEILLGFLSCFYDTDTLQLVDSHSSDSSAHTESAVLSIVTLQSRMRSHLQSAEYAQLPRETQKEIKSMYSDIRKGSIASAATLLGSSPHWVAANQTAYWDLCLKSLASPVLFTAGYKALSHDESFTTRMLTFLQTALRGIVRYSVSAADDIILSLQDLVDTCGADCGQLFTSDDSLPYNIPQALLDAYSLCPKSATASSQAEAQLNWRVAVVVTLNSLVQQSTRLHTVTTQQQTRISLAFLGKLLSRLTIEVVALTQTDSSSKKSRRSGNAADLRVELLQSLTVTLVSTTELIKSYQVYQRSAQPSVQLGLRHLAVHLSRHLDRPIIFEDDRVQVCSEIDLLVRVVALLSPSNGRERDEGGLFLMVAVLALSNMLLSRNRCDVSLVVDLSKSLTVLDAEDFSVGDADLITSEVREELRCLHASSLSCSDVQPLRLDSDVIYEATREALLSLAHHCCKDGVAAGDEEESKTLQRIYDSLPLEVNQQPALDTSEMSGEVRKLEVKSSFPLDILNNLRDLIKCQT